MNNELIKTIEECPGYYISSYGNVYSDKSGNIRKLKPFLDSRGLYLMIRLLKPDGTRKSFLIHRLVAIAFIPNPDNLPEVNHKDKNTQNPNMNNLEWCTRKVNLLDSYETMSPARNINGCTLYRNDELIGRFESVRKACRYAKENFSVSSNSLEKYLRCGDLYIITDKTSRRIKYDNRIHSTQNRTPVRLYKNGIYLGEFKSCAAAGRFLSEQYNYSKSNKYLFNRLQYDENNKVRELRVS